MALILLDGNTIMTEVSDDDLRIFRLAIDEALESGEDTEMMLETQTVEIIMNPKVIETEQTVDLRYEVERALQVRGGSLATREKPEGRKMYRHILPKLDD
tara:strand:- start:4988 stop:5287 length:300 start_codon:yes stop_codon:yes gene_type:complete